MLKPEIYTVLRKPLQESEVAPEFSSLSDHGVLFLDFGKAAFGTLLLPPSLTERPKSQVVHLGEQLSQDGSLNRSPEGSIRYCRLEQLPSHASSSTRLIIPSDPRNTGPAAIRMPDHIGEVFPFRYAEIEAGVGFDPASIRQIRVQYPFDDSASAFKASKPILNEVWELCKHSIQATTFCGVYVDGDRERIPYEGDAYINQLGHYCIDSEYALGRYTHEYLIQNPTWPTEWVLHSVMMAWADYLYTGETLSLISFYQDLCAKTLIGLAREDGLISTQSVACTREYEQSLHLHGKNYIFDHGLRDLVDWPPGSFTNGGTGERDNHEMLPINTVVNAFHCHALLLMSKIAHALGHTEDQMRFASQAGRVKETMNRLLFHTSKGVYIDGEGSEHASLHSNMLMLAFDLVPTDRKSSVVSFIKTRGMACSVYGAQYLLEALYQCGEEEYALELMTAKHERSWWNMIREGSTITWEAWDLKYKTNLDWTHAWGAVPANIIPRYLLGVRPLEPGFSKVLIEPQPGSLASVSGTVPTPHGSISIAIKNSPSGYREMTLQLPHPIQAKLGLKQNPKLTLPLKIDGKITTGHLEEDILYLEGVGPGTHTLLY